MYSESSVASPEEVDCYEECVVSDEVYLSSSPTGSVCTPSALSDSPSSRRDRIPKSNSGRITKKTRSRQRSQKEKKCSSPLIIKWLDENYEMVPGACLPRSVLYTHYTDFCKRNQVEPSSAASFGKIIRMKFPNLSTRRLGTRGQSKYHYYGLAIKETSIYYRSVYSKKGLTRFSGASLKRENGQTYNPSSKTGILLPEFPKMSKINFSKPFPVEKVETFLLMYKAHCQRILDSVVRANFHEVQDFLVHFWQGMPTHMLPILSCQATVDLVVVCDFVLYRTLCEVLIPATLQPLPDNLVDEIIAFSHNIGEWLFGALQDLPAALGIRKMQTAELFGKSLRRQTALVQLAKGARGVLRNSETVSAIMNEWRSMDFSSAAQQATFNHEISDHNVDLFQEFASELEQLFVKQSSLEVYFEWLDSLIERRVAEPSEKGIQGLADLTQDFILTWSRFYTAVEKEMIMLKGASFDAYRTLHLLLDEYVNYVMEELHTRVIEGQYNDVLKVHGDSERSFNLPAPNSIGATFPAPVFPPTPDQTPGASGNNDREFFQSFKNRLATDFQEHGGNNVPLFSTLQSPGYNTLTDSFYEGFLKHELGAYSGPQSCSIPSSLTFETTVIPHHSYVDTASGPLTPQSLHYSTGSPLSHTSSQHTPEPTDYDFTRPQSQGSVHSIDSPHPADVPPAITSQMYTTSSASGSTCTSPLTHAPTPLSITGSSMSGSGLDIATPFELSAAEGSTGLPLHDKMYEFASHGAAANMVGAMSFPHGYTSLPPHGIHPVTPTTFGSAAGGAYSHYDYELLQLMGPNPDDLLVDPFCAAVVKDTKPLVVANVASPSPCTTPIH